VTKIPDEELLEFVRACGYQWHRSDKLARVLGKLWGTPIKTQSMAGRLDFLATKGLLAERTGNDGARRWKAHYKAD